MIQDLLVGLLILGALLNIAYQTIKLIRQRNTKDSACGGCCECQLKKTPVQHDR